MEGGEGGGGGGGDPSVDSNAQRLCRILQFTQLVLSSVLHSKPLQLGMRERVRCLQPTLAIAVIGA